jgi:FkbM family methyltransferase
MSASSIKLDTHATKNISSWFLLRCLISQALGRSNQVIRTYRRDRLSHIDLEQDLSLLIQNPRPLLLDVGANNGQTIAMFQRVFRTPIIHAFEPNKKLVESTLAAIGDANPDIVLNAAGLGAETGSMPFHEYVDDVLNSLLEMDPSEGNPFKGRAERGYTSVPVWTLDNYVAEHHLPKVDLLKIDTQGYELHVLQGAQHQLSSGGIRLVMLEINFVPMYSGQPTFAELDNFLRQQGFVLVDMYEKVYSNDRLAWCTGLYEKC